MMLKYDFFLSQHSKVKKEIQDITSLEHRPIELSSNLEILVYSFM